MLTLRTLEGRMFSIEHDAITALEEAADHTMVWCGNQLHRVKEDYETVWDMWTGYADENDRPEGTLGMIDPQLIHSHLTDNGVDPDTAFHLVNDLSNRTANLGKPNVDSNGHPVISPPIESVPQKDE